MQAPTIPVHPAARQCRRRNAEGRAPRAIAPGASARGAGTAPGTRVAATPRAQKGLASTSQTTATSSSTGTSLNQRSALAEGSARPASTPFSQRPATA